MPVIPTGGRPRKNDEPLNPDAVRRGQIIEKLRKERGISQTGLAGFLLGADQSYISKLERGTVDPGGVGVTRFSEIAAAFGLTISELGQALAIENIPDAPPSSLEYEPDGAYIRLRGLVAGGNGEPAEIDGEFFFVPRPILKRFNVRNPDRELAGYMVNGSSMFYASEGVRARGLKNGDLIAVHRFMSPTEDTPMVVAWDKRDEKMLVKLMDEGEDWIVFRSVNSSANPPITRHKDEIHLYGTVIMRITANP